MGNKYLIDKYLIDGYLIDGCLIEKSKRVKVNFSDEDALFSFWFYLINLCLSEIDICKNN